MAANTVPITPVAPATSWGGGQTAADTSLTSLTAYQELFTAGSNGAKVNRLRVVHRGTNVATVLRVFINNGSTPGTAANNSLVAEETIAANTISQTAKSVFYDIPLNLVLKPGHKILYSVGTAVAAGHQITVDAGDY